MAGVVVLIAIDTSNQAESAFEWYLQHLHRHGNQIVVLHSVDLSAISDAEENYTSEASFTHMWHQQHTKIKQLEDKYRWKLNEQGIPGKIRTENGKAGDIIIRVAKEEKARLIVIGSRGLSRLKRTLQGSVSDFVLHHAHCPVVICRLESADDDRRASTCSTASMASMASMSSMASVASTKSPRKSKPKQPIPKITIEAEDT